MDYYKKYIKYKYKYLKLIGGSNTEVQDNPDVQSIVMEIKENIKDFQKRLHIVIFLRPYYDKINLHIEARSLRQALSLNPQEHS